MKMYTALLSTLILLFPLGALARSKNQHPVDILDPVQVGTTQLKPGDYQVEWQESGPQVRVSFVRDGRIVATVPGTLKTNDAQVTQDDIVTDTTTGNKKVLKEIDFSHAKEALLFG
ncbi:MAG: hypothetical protein ACRD3L_01080 [Terriglobales bacterium]